MCGALPCGQDQRESQAILHHKHELLFCQVEAEGLEGEGPESVPCSLPGQALELCLVPGVDSPPQESSPHLIVHHQGQLPLSVGQCLLQKGRVKNRDTDKQTESTLPIRQLYIQTPIVVDNSGLRRCI